MLAVVVRSSGPLMGPLPDPSAVPSGLVAGVALAAHVAALLVLLAGVAKLHRPRATREALAWTHPLATATVRSLGGGEIALALVVLAVGGRGAFGMLALAYGGFIAVAVRQRRAGRGCGCFGMPAGRVSPVHLVADGVAVLAGGAAAVLAVPGVPAVLPDGFVPAVASVLLLVTAAGLGRLVLTALPELGQARALVATGEDR